MNSNSNQSPSNALQSGMQSGSGQGQSAYGLQNGVTPQTEQASRQLNGVQIPSGEQAARAAGQQFMQTGNAELSSSVLQDTVNSGRQSVQNPQAPPQGMQ